MPINIKGYSKTPLGEVLKDKIRFTCVKGIEDSPQDEVLIGAVGILVPDTLGYYDAMLSNGTYLIELQQNGKEWVGLGTVVVTDETTSPISIVGLINKYPYTPPTE